MKTFDELQGMTHEDLVRYVQELQESNEVMNSQLIQLGAKYDALEIKHRKSVKSVKSLAELLD